LALRNIDILYRHVFIARDTLNSVFEGIQWDRVEEGWSESISELPSSSEEEWDEEEESDDVSDQALNQNRYGYQVPAYGRHKSDSEVTYRFSDADTLSLHSLNRGGMSPGDRAEDEFDETLDHYLSDVSGSGSCDALEAGYGSEHGDEAKATPYSSQTSDDSSFRDSDDDRSNETYSCGSDEEASAAYDTYGGLNLLDGSDSSDDMEDADEDTDDASNQDSSEGTESWLVGSNGRAYAMDTASSSSDAKQHAFGASKSQKAESDTLPVLDATVSGHHIGTGSPEIPTMPSYFSMDSAHRHQYKLFALSKCRVLILSDISGYSHKDGKQFTHPALHNAKTHRLFTHIETLRFLPEPLAVNGEDWIHLRKGLCRFWRQLSPRKMVYRIGGHRIGGAHIGNDAIRHAPNEIEISLPYTQWPMCNSTVVGDSYLHAFYLPLPTIKVCLVLPSNDMLVRSFCRKHGLLGYSPNLFL
jgi:hypothetical protein